MKVSDNHKYECTYTYSDVQYVLCTRTTRTLLNVAYCKRPRSENVYRLARIVRILCVGIICSTLHTTYNYTASGSTHEACKQRYE